MLRNFARHFLHSALLKKYDIYSVLLDYTGDSCELLRDHCLDNICENDGKCERIPGGFSCSCKDGMYYIQYIFIEDGKSLKTMSCICCTKGYQHRFVVNVI